MSRGIGHEFMLRTQYRYLERSDQQKGKPRPPFEEPFDESQPLIPLPDPASLDVPDVNLRELIERRRSVREYSRQPFTLAELSYLLWCTQGVREITARGSTLRTVPSAGARHAFETYLLINRVQGLEPGLYRFIASRHSLLTITTHPQIAVRVTRACLDQDHVARSAVTFIWVAVPYRMTWRYGERGYRYLHLDAGHVCQNLYLAAESIGGGVCAIGAFEDEAINRLLGLDGEEQFVIYVATAGKKG